MGCMISRLVAKFAFFPPSPPSYQIEKKDNGRLTVAPFSSSAPFPLPDDGSFEVRLIDTKKGNKIATFFLMNPLAKLTVLYSHGNATDLGQLYDLFVQLKANLQVNLFGYDYSGYGASTGKPSESDTYADIEAAYQCLETEYGISQENLILYGQSVGSGPTLHLASKLPRLRGVVLHSAILSGLRVICHVNLSCCLDIYKNASKIQRVKCPVLVIHGTEDDVVEWRHGDVLAKMAREVYEPLWIKGGGHCNLEMYPEFVQHLSRFVRDVERRKVERMAREKGKTAPVWRCCRVECCWWPRREKCSVASFSCCCCPRVSTPSCAYWYCTCCNCFNVWRCCAGGMK